MITLYIRNATCVALLILTTTLSFAQQTCYSSSDLANEVTTFDLATGTAGTTISVPADIEASCYGLNGDTVWLLDEDELWYIDMNAGTPTAVEFLSSTGIDDDGLDGPFGDGIQFNDFDGMAIDTNGIIFAGNSNKSAHAVVAISRTTGKVIPGFFDGDDYLPVFNTDDVRIDGMAFDPITNDLFTILNTGNGDVGSDTLYKVNLTTGSTTFINDFSIADIEGMTFDNRGYLYVVTGNSSTPSSDRDRLWSVDINTAEVTELFQVAGDDNESCNCVLEDTSSRIEISGFVYWDHNNSQLMDYADTGHNDYTVYLYHDLNNNGTYQVGTDTLIDSTLTNLNGFYYFRLPYFPSEKDYITISRSNDLPSGSVYTTDNIETASFTQRRQVITNLNFGYNDDVNVICGYVFEDNNTDMNFQSSIETGTTPVEMYLYDDVNGNGIVDVGTDALLDSVNTDANGYYSITRTYTSGTDSFLVTASTTDIPVGDTLTTDNVEAAVFTSSGNVDPDNNFGHYSATGPVPNVINGIAYGDADEDASLDTDEARLENVRVDLYKDANNNGTIEPNEPIMYSQTTDANGFYTFDVDYTSFVDSFTKRITYSHNDAEQNGSSMTRSSSDLDFGDQKVGLRFIGLDIPVGAIILEANVTVTARDNGTGGTHTSTIRGEVSDYPLPFASFDDNISNRTLTDSSTVWNLPNFSAGNSVTTPDISAVIQNVIDSTNWNSGNNLVLVFNDDAGGRSAKSFNHADGATEGPILYIKYRNVSSTFSYIPKVDSTTGPSGSHLTTPETQTASFTSGGNIDSNNNFGFWGGSTPVPVTFIEINEKHVAPNNVITWSTASELDNSHFEIERLNAYGNFEQIGTVTGQGNSNQVVKYNFVDDQVLKNISHCRIKQVDFSGRFEYSEVIMIAKPTTGDNISVYPNPAKDVLTVSIADVEHDNQPLQLYNNAGQLIQTIEVNNTPDVSINTEALPNGLYFIQWNNKYSRITKKFIVSK